MSRIVPSAAVLAIEEFCPWTRDGANPNLNGGNAPQLEGVIAVINAVPSELLTVDGHDLAKYLGAVEAIRGITRTWSSLDRRIPFAGHHVNTVRNILAACPDAVPSPTAAELAFVDDPAFRAALRTDISSIETFLRDGEWKAATVLAGAVIETLLLWGLTDYDASHPSAVREAASTARIRNADNDLERWDLHELLTVANGLDFISEATFTAADLAKNFRNLIHPGRARRLAEECTRGTAYSAVGGMERVIEDLTKRVR